MPSGVTSPVRFRRSWRGILTLWNMENLGGAWDLGLHQSGAGLIPSASRNPIECRQRTAYKVPKSPKDQENRRENKHRQTGNFINFFYPKK